MSKIKNGGLDRYGTGPFEQQQFGTAGIEGVNDTLKGVMPFLIGRKHGCENVRNFQKRSTSKQNRNVK